MAKMSDRLPNERIYNLKLGDILTGLGLPSKGEKPVGVNEDIDCLSEWKGRKIAVEAKKGDTPPNRKRALVQAAERVTNGYARGGMAVCYPEGLTPEAMDEETRIWACPLDGEWTQMKVRDLPSVIRRVSDELGDIDAAAKVFKKNLAAAADQLSEDQLDDIVGAVQIPLGSEQPALRAALLVASACLFHSRLDGALARGEIHQPGKYKGRWPFDPLRDCKEESDIIGALEEAWKTILAVDYKPVFETALAAISAPRVVDRGLIEFIRRCAGAALAATGVLTIGQTDLLGRVFHFILEERKNTGAFYTSSAAGALLAGLAIRDEDVDEDLDYSVVDPACGTGTLLAASAARIQDIAGAHHRPGGRTLIEDVLHGYDIDITATHMAAVTLGLMSPDVTFRDMNIHRFPLGWERDEASAGKVATVGSLEFVGEDGLATPAGWPRPKRSAQVETGEDSIKASRKDLVIMNPPFFRDQHRHGQLDAMERAAVRKREDFLFGAFPVDRSHGGGMFLVLAERLCAEDGTIAVLLPTTGMSNPSTRGMRTWMTQKFHLEAVITSHDTSTKNGIAFSENTGISESLVILRRLNKGNRNRPTRFIQLAHNPKSAAEAVALAGNLRRGGAKGGKHHEVEWPKERIMEDDWSPVRFLSPYLTEFAYQWFGTSGKGLVPLSRVSEKCAGGRDARGAATEQIFPDAQGRRGLWFNNQTKDKADAPAKNRMRLEPDRYLHSKPGKSGKLDALLSRAGRLILPDRFYTPGLTLCGAVTDKRTVGSGWISYKPLHPQEGWEEAMCVYLNSSVGFLATLYNANPKILTYPKMSLEKMYRLPVPDLTDEQSATLAEIYREHRDTELLPFYKQGNDATRRRLDEAVCAAFGWNGTEVSDMRDALSMEPAIVERKDNK